MKINVVFDREKINEELQSGWGLSYLVDGNFLFDTGEKFDYLKENARKLNLDIENTKKIFISHEHWDHTGGLSGLLLQNKDREVYICSDSSDELKKMIQKNGAKCIEIKEKTQISQNIYSSGQMSCDYKGKTLWEQALVLDLDDGLVVVCGCLHPGIVKLAEKITHDFSKNIHTLLGGFHLMDQDMRTIEYIVSHLHKIGVKRVGPSHCIGFEAALALRSSFKDCYIGLKTGSEVSI